MPAVSEAEMTARAMRLARIGAAAGCTLLHDCGIGSGAGTVELARLQNVASQGAPLRIRGMLVSTLSDEWDKMGLTPGFGNDMCRIRGIKAWSDGSNQARTGYMREPYLGTDERGALTYTPDELVAAIRRAHKAGWQVGVHANGDAAIDVTIESFGKVLAELPRNDHRHRLEHCSVLHPEQIRRMAGLGLSPSFLIEHVYIWGKAFQERLLGPERASFYDPCKSAIEGGLRISLHSDYDVSPIRPLQKVETAVTRVMREGGGVLNPAERITREQAFRAVTIDAAWQVHEDHDLGSIESGKFADLVVLGEDPFEVPEDRISEVPVVETWLGGVRQAAA
jgi:predicted amidohydrolase YtcJ